MSKSKQIGTTAETYLVKYLKSEGFADADRVALSGALDRGDVRTAGVCWEVKAGQAAKTAADGLVSDWLGETEAERRNAGADLGVLVLARSGYGEKRVGQWWAVVPMWALAQLTGAQWGAGVGTLPVRLHLGTLVALLRARGYGLASRHEPQVQAVAPVKNYSERARDVRDQVCALTAGTVVSPVVHVKETPDYTTAGAAKLPRGARYL